MEEKSVRSMETAVRVIIKGELEEYSVIPLPMGPLRIPPSGGRGELHP